MEAGNNNEFDCITDRLTYKRNRETRGNLKIMKIYHKELKQASWKYSNAEYICIASLNILTK